MKILIIGFLVLFGWSALSTHLYVCHIKGLCNEREAVLIDTVTVKNIPIADTLSKTLAVSPAAIPENLVIYFAFDKSDFNPDSGTATRLNESMTYIIRNVQARLSITGYTDAIGSDEYNQTLGYRRARSVQNYFENKGVPAAKIMIGSKGEKEPAEDNSTSGGRAKNRRTTISVKQ
jgi:outer membrane protein OmpA-like peptidoglycan-associated protein